jgi:hypothetical protein
MASLLAFAGAHKVALALTLYFLASLLVAALPTRAQKWPVVGYAIVFLDWVSFLVHSDAQGTLQWPLIQRSVIAAAVATAEGKKPPTVPPLPLLLMLVVFCASCYHADHTPWQPVEYYEIPREDMVRLCAGAQPIVGIVATIPQAAQAALVEEAVCMLIRALPDAHAHVTPQGVATVVHADEIPVAQTLPLHSSGGAQ